jgi:hypothetical protein
MLTNSGSEKLLRGTLHASGIYRETFAVCTEALWTMNGQSAWCTTRTLDTAVDSSVGPCKLEQLMNVGVGPCNLYR